MFTACCTKKCCACFFFFGVLLWYFSNARPVTWDRVGGGAGGFNPHPHFLGVKRKNRKKAKQNFKFSGGSMHRTPLVCSCLRVRISPLAGKSGALFTITCTCLHHLKILLRQDKTTFIDSIQLGIWHANNWYSQLEHGFSWRVSA